MPTLRIHTDADGAWSDLAEKQEKGELLHIQEGLSIGALPRGMRSGAASVAMRIDLPDGRTVLAETSLALFLTAADSFRAAHGDPRTPNSPMPAV